MAYTLQQLAEHVGAQLHGDGAENISAVGTLENAAKGHIAFLSNSKYRKFLEQTSASAVLVTAADQVYCPVAALVVPELFERQDH